MPQEALRHEFPTSFAVTHWTGSWLNHRSPSAGIEQPKLEANEIPGWMSKAECRALYEAALTTTGPLLEIGHFVGQSTASLCAGIRDSKHSNQERIFRSYDLGFRSADELKTFYEAIHNTDIQVPPLYEELVFSRKLTTTEVALENLKDHVMDRYVTLISGNFMKDADRYAVIFCDALHESHEIALNLPAIIERSEEECLWLFHDMNEANIKQVLELAPEARLTRRVDSLAYFEVRRMTAI